MPYHKDDETVMKLALMYAQQTISCAKWSVNRLSRRHRASQSGQPLIPDALHLAELLD